MTFSRRDFLRNSAQTLSAAALMGSLPALASAAAKTRIEVQDVNGLALLTGGGDRQVIQELLDLGLDVNVKDADGLTALDYAMGRGYVPFLAMGGPWGGQSGIFASSTFAPLPRRKSASGLFGGSAIARKGT